MQTISTVQDSIYILGPNRVKVDELFHNSCQRLGLPCKVSAVDPGVLSSFRQPAFLIVCTDFAAVTECKSLAFSNQYWLISRHDSQLRQEAFSAGCSQVLDPNVSQVELDTLLGHLHRAHGADLLIRGISDLSTITAGGLSGPLHYMSLGLCAMNRELANLKPLFDDLHKAWFKSDKELLNKLRLILSVVNLQQSWAELERTIDDYETGLTRLRDIHNFLRLGTRIDVEEERQFALDEMVRTCLAILKERLSDGIQVEESVPEGLFCRMRVGAAFFGFVSIVSSVVAVILAYQSGRGLLSINGKALDSEMLELEIVARPEICHNGHDLFLPDLQLPRFIFTSLGIALEQSSFDVGLRLILKFPADCEEAE